MDIHIQVLSDRLLLTKVDTPPKESLLDVITDDQGALTGKVIGAGERVEKVKEGDQVLYKEQDAYPITYKNKDYLILREYDVIAIL